MTDGDFVVVDGVHNLRGPLGLPLLVWRTAPVATLVALGVPRAEATRLRLAATGSSKPAELSSMVLATGMWGSATASAIAGAVGLPIERIESYQSRPIFRGRAFDGARLTQPRQAALMATRLESAVAVGKLFRVPPFDAHLLRRRMRWLREHTGIDGIVAAFSLSDAELDRMWAEHGLRLRLERADLREAQRLMGTAHFPRR